MRARAPALVGLALLAAATTATAQPGLGPAGPEVPLGLDLTAVPVGSWAEYGVLVDGKPVSRQRYALVERKGDRHVLELTFTGGPLQGNVIRIVAELIWQGSNTARQVEGAVIQINDGQPMALPAAAQTAPFKPLDARAREADEVLGIPAGKFKTTRYRERTPDGRALVYWIAADAPPFGVVKLTVEGGSGPRLGLELAARGGGARRTVSAKARPYDQAAFVQELGAATRPR